MRESRCITGGTGSGKSAQALQVSLEDDVPRILYITTRVRDAAEKGANFEEPGEWARRTFGTRLDKVSPDTVISVYGYRCTNLGRLYSPGPCVCVSTANKILPILLNKHRELSFTSIIIDEVDYLGDDPVFATTCEVARLLAKECNARFIVCSAALTEDGRLMLSRWVGGLEVSLLGGTRASVLTVRPYVTPHDYHRLAPSFLDCLARIARNQGSESTIVFIRSKRAVRRTAGILVSPISLQLDESVRERIRGMCREVAGPSWDRCSPFFRHCAEHGVVFETGSSPDAERRLSSILFREGLARFLVATNTIERGVNVDSSVVVIARPEEWKPNTLVNMAGRAGRMQKEPGRVILVTLDPDMNGRRIRPEEVEPALTADDMLVLHRALEGLGFDVDGFLEESLWSRARPGTDLSCHRLHPMLRRLAKWIILYFQRAPEVLEKAQMLRDLEDVRTEHDLRKIVRNWCGLDWLWELNHWQRKQMAYALRFFYRYAEGELEDSERLRRMLFVHITRLQRRVDDRDELVQFSEYALDVGLDLAGHGAQIAYKRRDEDEAFQNFVCERENPQILLDEMEVPERRKVVERIRVIVDDVKCGKRSVLDALDAHDEGVHPGLLRIAIGKLFRDSSDAGDVHG